MRFYLLPTLAALLLVAPLASTAQSSGSSHRGHSQNQPRPVNPNTSGGNAPADTRGGSGDVGGTNNAPGRQSFGNGDNQAVVDALNRSQRGGAHSRTYGSSRTYTGRGHAYSHSARYRRGRRHNASNGSSSTVTHRRATMNMNYHGHRRQQDDYQNTAQ